MRSSLFLLVFSFSIIVHAQKFSSEIWHNGYLVTVDQDTVRGTIKYDMETNIVLVSRNNVIQSFSSHTVFYFEIFDKIVDNYRQFYTIPYKIKYDYEIPVIFELVYEGPLSLLSRESIGTESINTAGNPYGTTYMRQVVVYSYYFLNKEGKITYYIGRKADLLVIMAKKQSQVNSFIKKNKLNPNDIRDLIRITAFYNSL